MDKKLIDRINKSLKEIEQVYKKHGLKASLSIYFPKYPTGKIPIIPRLAIWVLARYGGIIDTNFTDLKKK